MKHHIKVLGKKKIRKKFEIFDIIRGLILLEKCQFFNYDNVAFLWSIKPSFLCRRSSIIISKSKL